MAKASGGRPAGRKSAGEGDQAAIMPEMRA
ncbi:hypothetical protein RLEG3_10720 [Rhizobium leguminosarum bv. trifolii WSM1689]|nr:hypothetical protein RLEG3_10720 [Rhizobium leguminosarum bv. trifolii WSM1689]